jgi:hypothetical protein
MITSSKKYIGIMVGHVSTQAKITEQKLTYAKTKTEEK